MTHSIDRAPRHGAWAYPALTVSFTLFVQWLAYREQRWLPVWLAVGGALALALGRTWARREEHLWSLCTTDAATGLANRRQFQQCLEREVAQMLRSGQPLALLLLDLDGLKAINDRHGHAVGDAAIRATALTVKRACRAGDLVARWGGDEFAVLAACAGETEARGLADRISLAMRDAGGLPHALQAVALSVCAGLVVADPGSASASRPAALFAAADKALYRAKSKGHGHVESAGASLVAPRSEPVLVVVPGVPRIPPQLRGLR